MLLVSLIPKHILKPWPWDAIAGGRILEGGLGIAPLGERRRPVDEHAYDPARPAHPEREEVNAQETVVRSFSRAHLDRPLLELQIELGVAVNGGCVAPWDGFQVFEAGYEIDGAKHAAGHEREEERKGRLAPTIIGTRLRVVPPEEHCKYGRAESRDHRARDCAHSRSNQWHSVALSGNKWRPWRPWSLGKSRSTGSARKGA